MPQSFMLLQTWLASLSHHWPWHYSYGLYKSHQPNSYTTDKLLRFLHMFIPVHNISIQFILHVISTQLFYTRSHHHLFIATQYALEDNLPLRKRLKAQGKRHFHTISFTRTLTPQPPQCLGADSTNCWLLPSDIACYSIHSCTKIRNSELFWKEQDLK